MILLVCVVCYISRKILEKTDLLILKQKFWVANVLHFALWLEIRKKFIACTTKSVALENIQ